MPLSQQLKEIYASAPTTQRYIETLAFTHSRFAAPYYLTNDNVAWSFLLESGQLVTFNPLPFRIVLPTLDGQGNQDMSLTIANVGRDLVDPLEAAIAVPAEPVQCTYRVYLDTPSSSPQNTPPMTLTITSVQVTKESVSAVATRADVLSKAFPYVFYKYDQFPGLRR